MVTVTLPGGARVRGRRACDLQGERADHCLLLVARPVPPWPSWRIDWPDFGVPRHSADAVDALREAHARACAGEVVEVACRGGVGRTGTALAALAMLDGLGADEAVRWVRAHHHPRSVETPWQRWWLHRVAHTFDVP